MQSKVFIYVLDYCLFVSFTPQVRVGWGRPKGKGDRDVDHGITAGVDGCRWGEGRMCNR